NSIETKTSITTYGKNTEKKLNPTSIIVNNTIKMDVELPFSEKKYNDNVVFEIYRGTTKVFPTKPAYYFISLNQCEGLNIAETISCVIKNNTIFLQLIIKASIDLSENYLQPVINKNGKLLEGKEIRLPKIYGMSVKIKTSVKVYNKNMKTVENPTEVNVGESLIYNYTIHLNGFQNISGVTVEIRKVLNNNTTVYKYLQLEYCIGINKTDEFSCLKMGNIVYAQVNLTVTVELKTFSIFPAICFENYIFSERVQGFPKINGMSVKIKTSVKVYNKNMKTVENPTEVNVGESLIYNYTIHLNGFQNISGVTVEIHKVLNNNTTVYKYLQLEYCIGINKTDEFSCLKMGNIVYAQVNLTVTVELKTFSIFPAICFENYIFSERVQGFPKINDGFIDTADLTKLYFSIIVIAIILIFLGVLLVQIIKKYRLTQVPGSRQCPQALNQLKFQDDENNKVPLIRNNIPERKNLLEDKP
ncbi:hypothetical protein Bpfe_003483, partial [Biomphalaria pfeifferi]